MSHHDEPKILNLMDALKQSVDAERRKRSLAEWEAKCLAADNATLGHLLFTAPTKDHAEIAERIATRRLAGGTP